MTEYGEQIGREPYAQVAETHSAVVFFAGDRAYKLKKPVDLGFLDFSIPEARAAACARDRAQPGGTLPTCISASPRSAARTARCAITWS